MKIHLLILCLFVAFLAVGNSFAQIADPHCYYPKFDNRSEVDTIYGNYTDQFLGDFFRLPPLPNTTTSRLAISGLKKGYSQYWEIAPQAPFNLHNLTITNPERLDRTEDNPRQNVYGHFRNSKDWDMISGSGSTYFIYWSDANGLYDTSRRSYLSISVSKYHFNFARTGDLPPIVTHCSSDTVDDIFFGVTTTSASGQDTMYLAQYVGGEGLKTDTLNTGIRVVNPDTLYFFDTSRIADRVFKSGNFSGSGHLDVVGHDRSDNLFYYHNTGKFDPWEFARAMHYDTLVVAREQHYSHLYPYYRVFFDSPHSDRVLSKPDTDSSEDLMFWYVRTPEDGTSGNRIRMAFLRGGVNFGSTRIQLDSVPTIRDLGTLESAYSNFGPDPYFYIGQIDRSPNANKYVMINYGEGTFYEHYFLYMLGDAFDDQADMIFEVPFPFYRIQAFDTVDANGDRYADILFGAPTYTSSTSSLTEVGTMGVIYGNAKIPHLVKNGVAVNHLDQNIPSCTIRKISDRVLQIEYSLGEVGDYVLEVRDILGRLIATKWLGASDLASGNIQIPFSRKSTGFYVVAITGTGKHLSQKFLW